MRVLRTILGMLLLTMGLPSLLGGAALWAAMQHRDPGGAFSGELQRLSAPGYAFVVPDVDRLLQTDAPFARFSDTQLRINVQTQDGPAFVGLAPTAAVAQYLHGVPHSTVRTVDIGTGTLPVATAAVPGRRAPARLPGQAAIWLRASADGHISWSPGDVRGGPYSLVVMSPGAKPGLQLASVAELRPGWLDSTSWGLITLGTLLFMIGVIVLAWPVRRREIVYVVEPSQVPDLMAAIGAPLPINRRALVRPVGAHRPRTLADTRKVAALPAAPSPRLDWPPVGTPALAAPVVARVPTAVLEAAAPLGAAALAASAPAAAASAPAAAASAPAAAASAPAAAASAPAAAASAPAAAASAPAAGAAAAAAPARAPVAPAPVAPAPVAPAPVAPAPVAPAPVALAPAPIAPAPVALARVAPVPVAPARIAPAPVASAPTAPAAAVVAPGSSPEPAPGKPLNFIKPSSAGGSVSLPLGDPPSPVDLLFGRRPERGGRRAPEPSDLPLFQASAVGAWVAATAPERAREAEATAAARMAEVARKRSAAEKPADERPAAETNGEVATPPSRGAADTVGSGQPAFGDRNPAFGDRVDVDAVAGAYAAGAADARAETSRPDLESAAVRNPRTAGQRVAVVTGPNATDWASNRVTRAGSARMERRQAGSSSSRAGAATAAGPVSAGRGPSDGGVTTPAGGGVTAPADGGVTTPAAPVSGPAPASTSTPTAGRRVGGAGAPAARRSTIKPEAGDFPQVLGLGRSSVAGEELVPGEPPLSASRARQATGAGAENGRDYRPPVSAPELTSTDVVAPEVAVAPPAGEAAAKESSAGVVEPAPPVTASRRRSDSKPARRAWPRHRVRWASRPRRRPRPRRPPLSGTSHPGCSSRYAPRLAPRTCPR